VDRSIDDPHNFIKSNIVGAYNLLESFKKFSTQYKKTLLIHISTDEVYGDVLKGRSNEKYPYKPSSPYAASKASSDHLVYSYIRTYKVPAAKLNMQMGLYLKRIFLTFLLEMSHLINL
jgi:dTDP-glucose 4,6-dehydratase